MDGIWPNLKTISKAASGQFLSSVQGTQRGPVMQPKGAEPWRVIPWESKAHRSLTFPDRNAVPSPAMRWDVRMTEPR